MTHRILTSDLVFSYHQSDYSKSDGPGVLQPPVHKLVGWVSDLDTCISEVRLVMTVHMFRFVNIRIHKSGDQLRWDKIVYNL